MPAKAYSQVVSLCKSVTQYEVSSGDTLAIVKLIGYVLDLPEAEIMGRLASYYEDNRGMIEGAKAHKKAAHVLQEIISKAEANVEPGAGAC